MNLTVAYIVLGSISILSFILGVIINHVMKKYASVGADVVEEVVAPKVEEVKQEEKKTMEVEVEDLDLELTSKVSTLNRTQPFEDFNVPVIIESTLIEESLEMYDD